MNLSRPLLSTTLPSPLAKASAQPGGHLLRWSAVAAAVLFALGLFSVADALSRRDAGVPRAALAVASPEAANPARRAAAAQFEAAQSEAVALRRELIAVEGEKERFEAAMKNYLLDHKMALAALAAGVGGGKVALDDSKRFSAEAKTLAGTVAFLGILWAIGNHQEVLEVADRLAKADIMMKGFDARMAKLRGRVTAADARAAEARRAM